MEQDDPVSAPPESTADDVSAEPEPFDAPVRSAPEDEAESEALIVSLDAYEGPMDVLLDLARRQKVDLLKISVLTLVEQYLEFVEEAKARKLELAADYLVMASWLTYLKSKLLIPKQDEAEDEPTADEMAAQLAFQLQRLEAMRAAADKILELPQLGSHYFPRGMPEGVRVIRKTEWTADLYDLLKAYTTQRVKAVDATIKYTPPKVYQIEEARERLSRILGHIPDWADLTAISPIDEIDAPRSSVVASAFNAVLEYAKAGKIQIRQAGAFQSLYVRDTAQLPAELTETSPVH
ncbi:ScpA family protein [Parvularcula sp. IMCC14364]|uniref:segregation and condensation protein A n=1 Tax=Parvularcula sp. IMCC14364 TaxID=3067902 RepID=UPI0027411E97|nr:ScpA family protein [Parvularcula sp. IMCC14364]